MHRCKPAIRVNYYEKSKKKRPQETEKKAAGGRTQKKYACSQPGDTAAGGSFISKCCDT